MGLLNVARGMISWSSDGLPVVREGRGPGTIA